MCWAFNLVPSQLDRLFERVSYRDITTKLRLKVGAEQANHMQAHQSLVMIATAVCGGESEATQNSQPAAVIESSDHLQSILNGLKHS